MSLKSLKKSEHSWAQIHHNVHIWIKIKTLRFGFLGFCWVKSRIWLFFFLMTSYLFLHRSQVHLQQLSLYHFPPCDLRSASFPFPPPEDHFREPLWGDSQYMPELSQTTVCNLRDHVSAVWSQNTRQIFLRHQLRNELTWLTSHLVIRQYSTPNSSTGVIKVSYRRILVMKL